MTTCHGRPLSAAPCTLRHSNSASSHHPRVLSVRLRMCFAFWTEGAHKKKQRNGTRRAQVTANCMLMERKRVDVGKSPIDRQKISSVCLLASTTTPNFILHQFFFLSSRIHAAFPSTLSGIFPREEEKKHFEELIDRARVI